MTERSQTGTSWLVGGGEMGDLIRAFDWSQTALGATYNWSQSLKALVKMLLTSSYPMVLTWGKDFMQFYNDAYAQLIGDKHPAALGIDIRVTLAEAWDTLGPMIHRVMETGVANWTPALLLVLERSGYREESYFSVSHAPAEDDFGQIVGMLAVCSEVTQQVLGERRLRLLRDLASKAGETRSVEAVCQDLMAAITAHPLDVPFALLYLRDPVGNTLTLQGAVGLDVGEPISPCSIDLTTQAHEIWPLAQVAAGETVLVEAINHHQILAGGQWNEPVHSALVMPIASSGQTATLGMLVAGVNPNRALDEGYRSFYELLAGQISVSIRNAHAYEDERKRAEALAELDRAKTTFFSNVSHEFRTPLTLMLAPLEDALADQDAALLPRQRERLELAWRNSLRLLKLVNTLLDFSRIEAGRMQASYEPIDLASLTAELASVFRSAIEQAGLRLSVECSPLPELVYVDREMWEKIVLNLLSNALKFTFAGEITVSLQAQARSVELQVRDTGTGIPAEALPHLFERFYRVVGAQGRSYEGSGIGLALVQELVKLHGGTIAVSSTLGVGTTFTVTIPTGSTHLPSERLRRSEAQSIRATQTLQSTAIGADPYVEEALRWLPEEGSGRVDEWMSKAQDIPSTHVPKITVVEDNADMRDYIKRLLNDRDTSEIHYDVEAVANGAVALAAIEQFLPDLVLTDVMMPELDGLGLLRALRMNPKTREIPIILLSARAGEESRVEGLEAGADDYLIKPFAARELLARVDANLKLGWMRREAMRKRVRNILESITDAFVALDFEWQFIYVNQQAEVLFGKPQTALMGQTIWQVFPELANSSLATSLRTAMSQRVTVELEEFHPRFDSWLNVNIYPSDEGVSVYLRDISDRKQAEEERDRFFALSLDLLCIAGLDGYFKRINPAFETALGYTQAELLSKPFIKFVHPDDRAATLAEVAKLSTGIQTFYFENRYRCADGSYKWLAWTAYPVLESGLVYATARDMTEHKQAEAEIRQLNETLEQRVQQRTAQLNEVNQELEAFTYSVSHDIQAPLRAIQSFAQIFLEDYSQELDLKGQNYAQRLKGAAADLTQLVQDLLAYSRLGRTEIQLKSISLATAIKQVMAQLETVLQERQAQITVQATFPIVLGHQPTLLQIISNLLTNALKFVEPDVKPQIQVWTEEIGDYIRLWIEDNGIGIAPRYQERIFWIFERLHGTEVYSGTGVGLAIVKKGVDRLEGRIGLESELGQGSRFWIELRKGLTDEHHQSEGLHDSAG